MKRETVVSIFFFLLLAFVLYQLFLVLRPFLGSLFWSGVITFACFPFHRWLRRRWPSWSDNWVALVSTAAVLGVVLPLAAWVVFTLSGQAIRLVDDATAFVESGRLEEMIQDAREIELVSDLWSRLPESLREDPTTWAIDSIQGVGGIGKIAGTVTDIGRRAVIFLTNLLLTAVLVFFFFRDGRKMRDFVYEAVPMDSKSRDVVFDTVEETLDAVIRGQFLNSLAQGLTAWIIYWIFGVPLPLFFGFLTMLASFVPVTGAASIWFPWAVYFLLAGSMWQGIGLLVAGAAGISLLDNFLKPILIGERTKIPILLLFLGILGGLNIYGLTGIFIAPILLALMFVLVRQLRERFAETQT